MGVDTQSMEMDMSDEIDLSCVECVFEIDTERSEREPYPWGEGRGFEEVINRVTLEAMHLGELRISRNLAVGIFGKEAIERLESRAMKIAEN